MHCERLQLAYNAIRLSPIVVPGYTQSEFWRRTSASADPRAQHCGKTQSDCLNLPGEHFYVCWWSWLHLLKCFSFAKYYQPVWDLLFRRSVLGVCPQAGRRHAHILALYFKMRIRAHKVRNIRTVCINNLQCSIAWLATALCIPSIRPPIHPHYVIQKDRH